MKSLFVSVLMVSLYLVVQGQTNKGGKFRLDCHLIDQDTGTLIIHYRDHKNQLRHDTGQVRNKKVTFSGFLSQPTSVWLQGNLNSFSVTDPNNADLFLEPGKMTATLKRNEFKGAKIQGSRTHQEFTLLQNQKKHIFAQMQPLESAFALVRQRLREDSHNKKLQQRMDSIHKEFEPYNATIKKIDLAFITTHGNSFVSPYLLLLYMRGLSLDSLTTLYNNFELRVKQSREGQEIFQAIDKMERTQIGRKAPDFSASNVEGQEVRLSTFKGKYVLLHFWATWCVPCRKSSPELNELFKNYNPKGLEIINVANDDRNVLGWKEAIQTDGTGKMHQVLQGVDIKKLQMGEMNPRDIGQLYGVEAIPVKILIDKEGVIIGRYQENFSGFYQQLIAIFK